MRNHSVYFLALLAVVVHEPVSLRAQPPEQPTLKQEVMKLFQTEKHTDALRTCLHRLAVDKQDAEARGALEMAFEYCLMVDKALELENCFRDWTAREPDNALAHVWLGALMVRLERMTQVEPCYQRALTLDPKSPEAHFRLAALRELQGKEAEAQSEWKKFLDLEPDSDRAWLVRHDLAVVTARPLLRAGGNSAEDVPTWSPDGKQIAYRKGWKGQLAVSLVESGEERVLGTVAPLLLSTDWSPEGRYIVTTGATEDFETQQLFLTDAVTGGAPRLLYGESPSQEPRWSPDGTRIIFSHYKHGLSTVAADGGGAAVIPGIRQYAGYQHLASFTPEGNRVCSSASAGEGYEILLWDYPDGQKIVPLTANGAQNQAPRMRPDGRSVLFSSDAGRTYRHVRVVAVSEPKRDVRVLDCFFSFPWGPFPDWSPDGRRFAVSSFLPRRLWVVTLGGLDTSPITLTTKPQAGGLMVSLDGKGNQPQKVTLTYRLFGATSLRVADGAVGKPDMTLRPGDVIECQLPLNAATKGGKYTVKLTAVTDRGERVVKLVDYVVK